MTAPPSRLPVPGPARTGRVVGVDVARCVALVGMMATHILPGVVDGRVPVAQQVAGGRASALFAVLAGTSLVLVAGRRTPVRGRELRGMAAGTVVRAGMVGLLGLLLGEPDSGIAVILVYYAVLFVVAVPFLAVSTRALVAVAVLWGLLAPPLSFVVRGALPPTTYAVPSFDSLAAPGALVRDLLLTGYYPVATWVPYLLVGIVVGRLDLRSARASGELAGAGMVLVSLSLVSDLLLDRAGVRAALAGSFEGAGWRGGLVPTLQHGLYGVVPTGDPWWLAVRAPHTGTTFDLLMTTGSALLVIAVCLPLARVAPRLLAVAFGAGAMTLTLYSLHVLLRTRGVWDGDDAGTFLGQVAVVACIGAVLRAGGHRGPLEVLVGDVSAGVRRAVGGRAGRVGAHD